MEGRSKLGSDIQILKSIRLPKSFIIYLLKIYLYYIILYIRYAYDIIYDVTYMWNLNNTNELIYKTEIDCTDLENTLMVSKGERGEG